jgi:peptide/nickel transport system substrate-binding protein
MSSRISRIFDHRLSRRDLLRNLTVGTAGLALFSACAPAPGQPAQTTVPAAPTPGTAPGAQPAIGPGKAFHGAWPYEMPPGGHFNTYVTKAIPIGVPLTPGSGPYWDLFQPPLGIFRWAENRWTAVLAQAWRLVPPDTFTVTLRSGVNWSDGTPFTSKDVATTFWVGRLENWTVWRYVDRIDTPDDLTVSFHMHRPSSIAERFIMRERMRGAASVFGDFAKRVQDLVAAGKDSESDEWKKLRQELLEFRPSEPLSVGPYKIDVGSMNEAQLTMVKNPGGYAADKVRFDQIVLYNGETPQVTPLVLAGEVDYATHGFPPATEKAFVDQGIRIIRPPTYTGPALYIHWEKARAFQDKRVRQAVAHAVNRDENASISLGESAKASMSICGMSDNLVPLWLTEADRNKLNRYEFDLTRAEALMSEAGFGKGPDGIWAKDGERMEYEVIVPAEFADWPSAAQHLAESLTRFGIKVDVRGVTQSQQPVEVGEGRFTLAIREWGAGNPHPQFSYTQGLRSYNTDKPQGGMKYPLKQETSSGPVDFDKLITEAGEGLDEVQQKTAISKMALAFNELLPIVPLWERYGNNPMLDGKRVTGWLPPDDPIYRNSPYADSFVTLMILDGTLRPA